MHISQHLDAGRKADLARDPNHCKAEQIGAAMLHLNGLLAERAVLNTAGQALDASRRDAFEAIRTDAQPIKTTPADSSDDGPTSLQPLGDAHVMICYSFNDNDGMAIDGATINAEFVHATNFSAFVLSQWEKAIRAEERKSAEIDRETALARSEE